MLLISNYDIRIFRGTSTGPNPNNYYDVNVNNWNETCYIADLNKDGYLDLIVHQYNSTTAGIFWGSSSGYSPGNMTQLPSSGGEHNIEVADFDKNNWLDILFVRENGGGYSYVFWGSSTGFNPGNYTSLANAPGLSSGSSVADLNNDDYLDIVLTSFGGTATISNIYRGGASGFSLWQTLQAGRCFGGSSIADLNGDNYLDILYTRGYGVTQQPVIYWGSSTGYSEANKSYIGPAVDASGSLIADYNNDDTLDIFIDNYESPPEPSFILKGPNFNTQIASLPTARDAHSRFREIGNVYNRKYYEDYVSSVFDAGEEVNWGIVEWDDSLPPGSNALCFVRGGDTPNPDSSWSGWDSLGYGDEVADSLDSRYLQYRVRLIYTNPSYLPYLYEVRIGYGPAITLILQPDQADSTLPSIPLNYNISVINIGIGLDTVDLVYEHNTTWSIILFDSTGTNPLIDHNGNAIPDVIVNINDTVPIILNITPPGSAQGGEIDSLRLIGSSDLIPALHDTVQIITTIKRLVSILVEPDQTDTTMAGVPVNYNLWVINLGTNLDTIDLAYQHNTIWGISLLDSTGTVPLGDHNNNGLPDVWVSSSDSVEITISVYPAGNAQPGETDSLIVTGHSNLNPAVTDNATLITMIGSDVWILIEPNQSGYAYPGIEKRYNVWAINRGINQDTIDLTFTHNRPWLVILYDSIGIDTLLDHNNNGFVDLITDPGDSNRFILSLTPSGTAAPGEIDSLMVSGRSSINTSVTDSALIITTIESIGTILIFPDQQNSGLPNNWVNFQLTCRNNQVLTDTVDLMFTDRLGYNNQLLDSLNNPLTDHNSNGMVDIPNIMALGGEADFNVRVFIPFGTPGNTIDSILLFGYSGLDSTIKDSASLILMADIYAQVVIMPDQSDSGYCGDSIDYKLLVQNYGNASDIIDLACIGGNFGYSLRDISGNLLTDTDIDGLPDVGSVGALGGSESLIVRVAIPTVGPGIIDTVIVRAYSSYNPSVTDDAQILTKALGGVWSLVVEPDQSNTVEVGQATSYSVRAILQASVSDVVDIFTGPVSLGWQAEILSANGDPLNDSDGDGLIDLGVVLPNIARDFMVRVRAPDHFDFTGLLDTLIYCDLVIFGQCSMREDIRDSLILKTILVPPFDVHNFRNPFRTQTQFIFSLPKDGRVSLEIYNRAGELVRRLINNRAYRFGVHYCPWDGRNEKGRALAPGTYIYILDFYAADGEHNVAKKKAVILK